MSTIEMVIGAAIVVSLFGILILIARSVIKNGIKAPWE